MYYTKYCKYRRTQSPSLASNSDFPTSPLVQFFLEEEGPAHHCFRVPVILQSKYSNDISEKVDVVWVIVTVSKLNKVRYTGTEWRM